MLAITIFTNLTNENIKGIQNSHLATYMQDFKQETIG